MAEGNGVDLGALTEMVKGLVVAVERLSAGQEALRFELRKEIGGVRTELRADIAELRAEVRADMAEMRKEIAFYHSSVMGHGILITELDERVTRLENERPQPRRA